jgi:hypothetical protein
LEIAADFPAAAPPFKAKPKLPPPAILNRGDRLDTAQYSLVPFRQACKISL